GRRDDLCQRHHPRRQHRDRERRDRGRQRLDHLLGAAGHPGRGGDLATLSERLSTLLREISGEILEAQRPIRVLRLLAWSEEVERRFFAGGGRELPRVDYKIPPEVAESGARFRALKARLAG